MELTQFENLKLTEQTKRVEGSWYFDDYKDKLVVKEQEVIFDNDFDFKLRFNEGDDLCPGFVRVDLFISGKKIESFGFFDYDKYSADPQDILKDICLKIANEI